VTEPLRDYIRLKMLALDLGDESAFEGALSAANRREEWDVSKELLDMHDPGWREALLEELVRRKLLHIQGERLALMFRYKLQRWRGIPLCWNKRIEKLLMADLLERRDHVLEDRLGPEHTELSDTIALLRDPMGDEKLQMRVSVQERLMRLMRRDDLGYAAEVLLRGAHISMTQLKGRLEQVASDTQNVTAYFRVGVPGYEDNYALQQRQDKEKESERTWQRARLSQYLLGEVDGVNCDGT